MIGGLIAGLYMAGLAPFEEAELRALFGEDNETYVRTHPRFLPLPCSPR